MEYDEDEQQQPSTPFWLQNTAFRSSSKSRRLGTLISSIVFNSTSFILLLLVPAALIFIFFLIIPSLFNITSQIFTPNSVKRTWDSLNLVLVLFAIICAFLGRTNNNDNLHSSSSPTFTSPSTTSFRRDREQWYGENSDRSSGIMRLRSISSYPDLRLQHQASPASDSSWDYADYTEMSNRIGNGYRFSDDTQLKSYQVSGSGWQISPRRGRPPQAKDIVTVRINAAGTEDDKNPNKVGASPPRLHTPPPPPPLQPPQPLLPFNPLPELQTRVQPKSKRTHLATEKAKAREANSDEEQEPKPSTPPNPSPRATVRRKTKRIHRSFDEVYDAGDDDQQQKPPSPPAESDVIKKSDKKRGGATKDFLSSFYSNQKQKKKRERRRSLDNLDYILNRSSSSSTTQPPPPPPPPPPLPSVFQSLFSSRKGRSKKSASDPPELTQPKSRVSKPPTRIAKAQPASTAYNNSHQQGTVARGNESPLYEIPEPPPLPPFGMPVWRFVVEGDYVRLKSMNSSRSGSPDLEEDRDDSVRSLYGNGESMRSEVEEVESSAAASPAKFCPSPDVNAKADNFIARFRAGLKLENVNSGNGAGLSRLGLGPTINNEE